MAEYIEKDAIVHYLKGYSEKELNSMSPYGMITSRVLDKVERALSEMSAADVQPVDRDSLQIVYIGRKAYHAENTIRSAIEAMDTIRDAIGHIEYTYSKHKELLSQISCCTKYGDATPEIDYYINKIKEATSQID